MKRFLTSLMASFTKSSKAGVPLSKRRVRLDVECLEGREMMTAAPMAPVITATGISSTQIRLTWNAVAGATGYQLDCSVNNGAWAKVNRTITGYQTSVTLTCTPGALYNFDLTAHNAAGYSEWATPKRAITLYHPAVSARYDTNDPAPTYSPAPSDATLYGPTGKPQATDVNQGFEGDCWLMASLAAVAARQPQEIRSMFTYEGTTVEYGATVGLYKIRFFSPSGVAEYVTVDTELPNGGTYYDRTYSPYSGNDVLWYALAEKAYAEANGLHYVQASYSGNSYDALYSGYPQWALHAITGKASANYSLSSSSLAAEWNAGDPIVLTSDTDPRNPYFVGGHAYAVVGYNGSQFEVLNPWGTDTNGTCPVDYDAAGNYHLYYGMYWFTQAYLEQDFSMAARSSGAAVENIAPTTPATTVTTPVQVAASAQPMKATWETPATHWDADLPTGHGELFHTVDNLAAFQA